MKPELELAVNEDKNVLLALVGFDPTTFGL
jgi:hypothetical protein